MNENEHESKAPDGNDSGNGNSNGEEHQTEQIVSESRSIAEWTTLAISVAIILAFVGVITWLQVTSNGQPAIVSVEPQIDRLRQEESGYYLPITVRNDGAETIEAVQIQASLTTESGETEDREFTIDFLVRDEVTSGIVVFQHDPAEGDLTVGAGSYKVP